MERQIMFWYDRSSPTDRQLGAAWYPAARAECMALADRFGFDHKRAVWAVAALSPQLKWERNIAAAKAVMQGRIGFPGVYSSNIEKALHILFDEQDWERWLSGPKVVSFARNIWGDPDTVTVDTWAWRIWSGVGLWDKPPNLERLYDRIAKDYKAVAGQVGIEPRALQAVTWIAIRRVANGRAAPGQLPLAL